jgi:hypothetical protein
MQEHTAVVKKLFCAGFHVYRPSFEQQRPIFVACMSGHYMVVSTLLA